MEKRKTPDRCVNLLRTTDKTIELFLSGIDSPRSLTIWLLWKYKEHDQLVDVVWKAEEYDTPAAARDAYLATNLLKKAKFLELSRNPRDVALAKFSEAERTCKDTNTRFRNLHHTSSGFAGANVALLERTRQLCHTLLGCDPFDGDANVGTFDAREWFESCKWGPGTNYSFRGNKTAPAHKFQAKPEITLELYLVIRELFPYAYPLWDKELREKNPLWGLPLRYNSCNENLRFIEPWVPRCELADYGMGTDSYYPPEKVGERWDRPVDGINAGPTVDSTNAMFTAGNRITCVAKNAKTDRVIAIEPLLNSWFQLGVGEMIRTRLLRYGGIDLRQQDRNQLLAYYGSRTGNLSTVDFSSASDTISVEVVRTLLPSEWFSVMDACRSKSGKDPCKEGTPPGEPRFLFYEKFSSMGNGFTFPLQSLIFTAAAIACCEHENVDSNYVGVYGDDVVIPSCVYGLFERFCSFLGFSIGKEKSFFTGFFRESCGAHYLKGVDLKPIYLEDRLDCTEDYYVTANNVRRLAHRSLSGYGCDRRFIRCWRYLVHQVPKELRFFIPEGSGDGGFVGNFDEARPNTVRDPIYKHRGKKLLATWVSCFQVKVMVQQPVQDEVKTSGLHLSRLLDVDRRHSSAGVKDIGVNFLREDEVSSDPYSPDLSGGGNSVPRRRATRTTVKWIDVPRNWYDLGPWL